jgi:hypothetical protein
MIDLFISYCCKTLLMQLFLFLIALTHKNARIMPKKNIVDMKVI